jgi:MFS family permease
MINQRSFRFLWIGQALANFGDVLYIVGLITLIYKLTGSVVYMTIVPFCITLSMFFGSLVAPLVIEQFKLKELLVLSQAAKTVALAAMSGFVLFFISVKSIYILFILIVMIGFLDSWATPARNAMVPRLVPRKQLVKANSFLAVMDQSIGLGAWPLGGILVIAIHESGILALTLFLFLLSTIMMMSVNVAEQREPSEDFTSVLVPNSKWRAMKDGWITIWHTPNLRAVSLIDFIESIANVVWIAAILYVYVGEVLHRGEQWWGYINASFFLGLIIGGFISLRLSDLIQSHLKITILIGSTVSCLITLAFGLTSVTWLALALSTVLGVFLQMKDAAQHTTFQQSTTNELLPKVYAAKGAIVTGTFGLSSVLFGWLAELHGVVFVFVLASLLLGITVLIARRLSI